LAAATTTRTATLVARTAGTTSSAAATTTATGSARRAADYSLRGSAEAVAGGVAEGVERSNNDNGNAHDQKRIFGCILTGILAPEAFE
jgi:hypothetical protein